MASNEASIIEIMNTNADVPMSEVCRIIASQFSFAESRARAYYSGMVRSGKAPGKVEAKPVTRVAKPKKTKAERMVLDASVVLAGGKMKGKPVKGMDLKALAHEEVLARLLARKPVDEADEDPVPEVKPIGEPDQDFPLSISEGELAEVLGR